MSTSGSESSRAVVARTVDPPPSRPTGPGGSAPRRVTEWDALRGFALCGILLVNIPQITRMAHGSENGASHLISNGLGMLVEQHFYPIFAFLFGLSFSLFLEGAQRSRRPRLMLARRLLVLGLLGAAHHVLQPGEALLPYAIFGLLVLLPASWLPTRVLVPVSVLAALAGFTAVSGGMFSIPGLFLLGLACARTGIARTVDRRPGQLAVVLVIAVLLSVPAVWAQLVYPPDGPLTTRIAAAAGVLGAVAYASAFLLVLRTRIGRPLAALVEPLGRMALTNYLTATLLVVAVAGPLGLRESTDWSTALGLALIVLAVQAAFSHWWLGHFRYGPAEWALRTATWWKPMPLRRVPA
ncbi:DUF418 domain-containing protein [Saccharopolyspora karakumensis]|uniref:DUF418 domain-containing protein n=1 Tax=Saccharopolyspora karakumensis TaxID=2530386 RepID=A0A4R5BRJ7_9PSEU|nr:DUF418 domain-containing protein [Saccharopolyspora karakumensis]TDD87880.1 DUF418 domain-containing protein [Saccharopolyspora karakumensis]